MGIYLGYVPRIIELELIDKSDNLFRVIKLQGVWNKEDDERAQFPPEAFTDEMSEGDKAKGTIRYNSIVGKMLPLEEKLKVIKEQ